jgi:hypothetical protein
MPALEPFLAILFLAFLAEGLTEYLFRPIVNGLSKPDEGTTNVAKPLWMRYAAMLVGTGLAIAFRADLFAAIGLPAFNPWFAYALTGIVAGRGSNYVHNLIDTWRTAKP